MTLLDVRKVIGSSPISSTRKREPHLWVWFFLFSGNAGYIASAEDRKEEKHMAYIISLMILCSLYFVCIACMKYMRNTKCFNLLFMGLVYASYLVLSYSIYRNAGFDDWNFKNTLPTIYTKLIIKPSPFGEGFSMSTQRRSGFPKEQNWEKQKIHGII